MEFAFTAEQRQLREQVFRFARKEIAPRVADHDLRGEFDYQAWKRMGEMGILGLHIPTEYGGSGQNVMSCIAVGEALGEGGVDGGLALAYGAHSFLCADTIQVHGTEAQRQKYLPKLATGEWIGCMALTEPGAGSDVASMSTRAEKRDGGYVLNGAKMFITNGGIADVAVVYAKTDPEAGHGGISAFIVEKGTKGFNAGRALHKLGMKSSVTSELFFEDCFVPAENLLGEEGNGFLMAMQTVEWDRSALLAPFLGSQQRIIDKSCAYAKERVQFGRPIASFQAVKHKIADMKILLEAARPLIYRVAWSKDQGSSLNHLEAAVAKLFLGDASLPVTNDALVLHGGYGYCHEYEVERVFRDARLAAIGGGTSDIQKLIISRLLEGAEPPPAVERVELAGLDAGALKAKLLESQRALRPDVGNIEAALAIARGSVTLALALDASRQFTDLIRGRGGLADDESAAIARGERIGAVAQADRGEGPKARLERAGDGWRLTCHKSFVTNGPVADWIAVFANAGDREAICLVSPRDEGIRIGKRLELMGLDGLAVCELTAESVRVDESRVLGPFGDRALSAAYTRDANFSLAIAAAGLMRSTLNAALAYAREHRRDDRPVFARQEVAFKLAEVFALCEAADLLCQHAGRLVRINDPDAETVVRAAKVFCTENAERAASAAMQVMGGEGYRKGSAAERAYRDAKGLLLAGTTVEVARMQIAEAMLER